jgi:hypothetical protein
MYSDDPRATGFDRVEAAFREAFPSVKLEVLHRRHVH